MYKQFSLYLLVVILGGLALSACVISASKAPPAAPTQANEIPFPVTTQQGVIQDILSGTQTAEALNTGSTTAPTEVPIVETTPVEPTETEAPTRPVVPTATPGRPETYALQPGEWPVCIARRFNVDLNTFFNLNGLTMNSKPLIGTVLKIPQSGAWNTGFGPREWHAHSDTYTVQSGDTIYSIACYFGDVDPNGIIAANDLKSPYTLTAGQVIYIP
jgi:LysM repeat protein